MYSLLSGKVVRQWQARMQAGFSQCLHEGEILLDYMGAACNFLASIKKRGGRLARVPRAIDDWSA